MALANVVYQVVANADFAKRMRTEPDAALKIAGLDLSSEELEALLAVLRRKLDLTCVPFEVLRGNPWAELQFQP